MLLHTSDPLSLHSHEAADERGTKVQFKVWRRLACPRLTQVTDVLPELLERGSEAFGVRCDFRGVQHKGHTVDLVFYTRPLHVVYSLWSHCLVRAELEETKEESRCSVVK